jgi:hypothetical protein
MNHEYFFHFNKSNLKDIKNKKSAGIEGCYYKLYIKFYIIGLFYIIISLNLKID